MLRWVCRISLEPDSCVRRAEDALSRNGCRLLLFAKFGPGLNIAAPPLVAVFRNAMLDRFVAITVGIFQSRQTPDLVRAQLWLMRETNEWPSTELLAPHGGRKGEVAFLRASGFDDRVGIPVNLGLAASSVLMGTIRGVQMNVERLCRMHDVSAWHSCWIFKDLKTH
jgi:hypothetical protein